MRTEKLEYNGQPDHYAIFSAGEIPALMNKYDAVEGGGWYGDSREELIRKATTGDTALVAEADKFLGQIEDQVPFSRGWRNIDDVVGAVPNVPAFLAGHPQCMRRRARVAKDNAPLTIYMDLTSSAAIAANQVTKRGVVLLALTRLLVEHRPVELWVGTAKDKGLGSGTAAWRIDTAPLDLARSAYHIGSSAMARGFGYTLTDRLFHTGGHWPFKNFSLHQKTAPERLKRVFGFGELLYIPGIYLTDPLLTKPVEWLKQTMKQYVNTTESNDD